jgi:hypothetical protein
MRKISPVIRDIPQEIHSVIVSEISLRTGITCEDIVETLKHYGLIKEWGTAGVVVLGTSQIIDSWCSSERKNNKTLFDANRLKWTPIFDFRNGTFPNASAAAAGG